MELTLSRPPGQEFAASTMIDRGVVQWPQLERESAMRTDEKALKGAEVAEAPSSDQPLRGKLGWTLSGKKAGPLTKDDGIFSLVGIGLSKVPGGASSRKHEFCK